MSFLDYAPAPESQALLHLRNEYGLFIDGAFVAGRGEPFQTINPATEKQLALIAHANTADVDTAVIAARRAYERRWSTLSGSDRGKYLFRIARLVQERARELAVAETVGEEWLTPSLFRFGASSLLNDVLMQRQKMRDGHYSGPDYVTID